ncbi:hypothetical protein EVAR_52965_1 [Eumeta japonica]|uniref:Uncharacterized protein n=1 Tax=Eumeta variegata TaxID=151549 RepID=A0A4C1YZZ5_EUMVA|nr:hypothetical protein EVAR_52965_1 [Eumeta japonica]
MDDLPQSPWKRMVAGKSPFAFVGGIYFLMRKIMSGLIFSPGTFVGVLIRPAVLRVCNSSWTSLHIKDGSKVSETSSTKGKTNRDVWKEKVRYAVSEILCATILIRRHDDNESGSYFCCLGIILEISERRQTYSSTK